MRFCLLILFSCSFLVGRFNAQVTNLPYSSDFEVEEGFVVETSPETAWLTTSDFIVVTDDESHSGSQSVRIPHENILSLPVNLPDESILFIDYYMQFTASAFPELPLLTVPGTTSMLTVQSYEPKKGRWVFLDGDGAGKGIWFSAGETLSLDESSRTAWHRITLRLNLVSNSWDAYIDDILLAADIGFAEALLTPLAAINIYGNSAGIAYLDAFSVSASNPLFPDEDLDGIDDDYELNYGLNKLVDDRDLDPDEDGIKNIEEYIYGTHPLVSNIVSIELPANGSLTEINEVNGNLRIINDGTLLLDAPLNEVYGLNIVGTDNSGDINILLDEILNGFFNVEGNVGTVTFNSALTVAADLSITGAKTVLIDGPVSVEGTTKIDVLESIHANASFNGKDDVTLTAATDLILTSGSISVIGGDLSAMVGGNLILDSDSSLKISNGNLNGTVGEDFVIRHRSDISVTTGSTTFNVNGAIQVDSGSRISVNNASAALGILQLSIGGSLTFDSNSVLAVTNADLDVFSIGDIDLLSSTLTVSDGNTFIRTNSNLTFVDSVLSTNHGILSARVARSTYITGSDITASEGSFYLNMLEDMIMDVNSSLKVTGAADMYTNIFGEAVLGGSLELARLFSMYVRGNVELASTGSLDSLLIVLKTGANIFINGRMDTNKVNGLIDLTALEGFIHMDSTDPILSYGLTARSDTGIFLRTEVSELIALAHSSTGPDSSEIEIREFDEVILKTVYNANGPIRVMAAGTLTAEQVFSVKNAPGSNIELMSTDGDLEVGLVMAHKTHGQVLLSARGNIKKIPNYGTGINVVGNKANIYASGSITSNEMALNMDVNELNELAGVDMSFVIFDLDGKGKRTGGGELVQTVLAGDVAIAPEVTSNPGWAFTGWNTALDPIVGDLTITAQYKDDRIEPNSPPDVVSPIADIIIAENSPNTVIPLHPVFADTETADEDLTFTVISNNTLLVTATIDTIGGKLNLYYSPNSTGSATITVTAEDNNAVNPLSVSNSFLVTVFPTYTVIFELDGKSARTGGGELEQTVPAGGAVIAPEVEGISGWIFTGWDVAFDSVMSDLTVTAQYESELSNSDSDGDGFSNIDEYRLNTSPRVSNSDSDADGIPDEIENLYVALDPNLATDALTDYDNDGVANIFEVYNNSNPDDSESTPVFDENSIAYFKVDQSLTEADAVATIAEAEVTARDYNYAIIEVLPGDYVENVSLSSSTLLIAPQGSESTILRSTNPAEEALTILGPCVLDGFTIRYDEGPAIDLDSSERIVIRNCSIASEGTDLQFTYGGGVSKSGGIVDIINCYMPEAEIYYKIIFDLGANGIITSGKLEQIVPADSAAIAPEVESDPGWIFTGWDIAFDSVMSDLTVTAQYESELSNSDSDGDGFSNIDEYRLNTSPRVSNSDSDADGIPDEIENLYVALDPNLATDALTDYDNDGVANIFEVYNNSNPDDSESTPVFDENSIAYFKVDQSLTEADAVATIAEAEVTARDYNYAIIEVLPGDYVENVSLSSSTLLIAPQGSESTILRSTNPAEEALTILGPCVLDGFTIRYDEGPAIDLDSSERIVIRNCSIASEGTDLQFTYGGGVSKSGGIVDIINCYMPEATE